MSVEAVTLHIGSGSATSAVVPINTAYKYSYTQSIYLQSELNRAGEIRALSFYFSSGGNANSNDWTVFLGHTTKTAFASTSDWVPLGSMTQVFSGTVTIPNPGWVTVTLSTPFIFNNQSNLVVAVDENNSFSSTAGYWSSFNALANRAISNYHNNNMSPGSPGTADQITANIPQIRFELPVEDPLSFSATALNANQIDLSWQKNSAANNVMLAVNSSNTFGTPIDGQSYLVGGNLSGGGTVIYAGSGTGFNHLALNPNTAYYYKLWSVDGTYYSPGISRTASTVKDFTVSPGSISRTLPVSAISQESITITNNSSGILNITNLTETFSWLDIESAYPFSLAAGQSATILIDLHSTGLANGTYNGNLVISTSSASQPSISVPVTMTIDESLPSNPRLVAEWENAEGAIVAFTGSFGLPNAMLQDLSNQGLLYVVRSAANATACNTALTTAGVNAANIRLITAAVDSYWIRDYGPMTIMDGSNNLALVDFTYNRNRPNDNAIQQLVASQTGLGLYNMPIIMAGGDIMTDSHHKIMSTNLVYQDNDGSPTSTGVATPYYNYSQAQIADLGRQYLGATEHFVFSDPISNTTADHIDSWVKLLDADKVMISRVPSGTANYAALEAAVSLWQTKTTIYGTPFRIYRVDCLANEPYANSFIFARKIYVPQMSATPSATDLEALAAYRNAMPGYTVQGYYYSGTTSFGPTDAIHSRVNTIHDKALIHVKHLPRSKAVSNSLLSVTAELRSAYAINPDSTYVSYRYWNRASSSYSSWQTVGMTNISGITWAADIPTPAAGDSLLYSIRATNNQGRYSDVKLCGRLDPFKVKVEDYHYRSKIASGTWENPGSWEFSNDGNTWQNAVVSPEKLNSSSITILAGHVISLNSNAGVDQMLILEGGKLVIADGRNLTLANGLGTDLQMNGQLTITGTISFETGATMLCGNNSTIEFNGNIPQFTGSAFPDVLHDLIINNRAGVTLDLDTQVFGTLTQTAGSVSGAVNPDGYSSPMNHLSFPKTGHRVEGWGIAMSTDALLPQKVNRQWNLSGTFDGVKVLTFTWTAEDDQNYDWIGLGKQPSLYKGSEKLSLRVWDVSSDPRYLSVDVSAFLTRAVYSIGFDGDDTLPVEFSAFTAVAGSGNKVSLQWITQSETNLVGFRIYRGRDLDLNSAMMLNTFISATNTSQTQVYVFADKEIPENGNYFYWLQCLDLDGSTQTFGPTSALVNFTDPGTPGIPLVQGINRAYPNPFNPRTRIQIGVLGSGPAKLTVFNLKGQVVKVLLDEFRQEGTYSLDWDGTDSRGKNVPSGVYQLVLKQGGKSFSSKLTLIK